MNAFFASDYQEELDATIQQLESKSSVEFVTVIYPECDNYRDIELWGGIFLAFIALVVKFMVPAVIHIYAILFGTLLFFSLGIGIVKRVPSLKYALLNKKRMRRQAEIMARAIFQKAHIHRTSQHTGVLLFVSTFERQAVLLWDIGVDVELTIDELDKLQFQFSEIFNTPNPPQALLAKIRGSIPVFEGHLPVQPNDINELPNHLHVEL
jgi:putative membrane protein